MKIAKWWLQQEDRLSYTEFQLQCGKKILVGDRPDSNGCTKEFANEIDYWVSVTDSFVPMPEGFKNSWFPWSSESMPPREVIFGFVRSLHDWINHREGKSVYVFSDFGNYRAALLVGAFMISHLNIVETCVLAKEAHTVNRKTAANPLHAIDEHLSDKPEDRVFLGLMKSNPEWSLTEILNELNLRNFLH